MLPPLRCRFRGKTHGDNTVVDRLKIQQLSNLCAFGSNLQNRCRSVGKKRNKALAKSADRLHRQAVTIVTTVKHRAFVMIQSFSVDASHKIFIINEKYVVG